jgi:uncharacterized cupin superfamily protein
VSRKVACETSPISTRPNIFDEQLPLEDAEGGFRAAELLRRAGAERLGGTVYELSAGARGIPLHVHHGNEEVLVVLSGTPTLRTPAGDSPLAPGDVVAFPAGARGAHAVENRSSEPARYLMLSTRTQPDVVEYPDAGTVRVTTRSIFDRPPAGEDARDALRLLFDRDSALDA